RELMAKMTEMSPEPPGFPSGIKNVEPTPPRRSGAWVFAVTALAVMAIALPFVFYNNDPDVGATDTTIPVDTTVPAPPSSTIPTTTIPAQAGPSLDWPIFLVHEPANSAAGN